MRKQRLKRLAPEFYRGEAWVHWTLTIADRRTGWLDRAFLLRFREILTHHLFRGQIACPIYCLMPDHIHLLWNGVARGASQLDTMRRLRVDLGALLKQSGFRFQKRAYDHVLRDDERLPEAIEGLIEYIAHNPERKSLLNEDESSRYPFTGCLMPGYPRLRLFTDGWDSLWKVFATLRKTECHRLPATSPSSD
ncbi:MAG: hypothetical protein Fues2KO_47610 [Fuerstiella sp.]